ncbi:hydroxylase/monooxygenase, ubiquinone biosynthesis hydroxylase [Komagataeibacter xylinus NBRC 13693]|uniref:Hydroxylase/monooxygenase, ubiquinone biosynthesis hydroxylase n=2 Tax=Komagataeibacter TaxID=1434011 RepID=A0A0D6Q5R7_KOMXY|nr:MULTISPECIES: UbiH/UbiF/VisC/COQ6 family ubiquinone biosynthesis hydroxylase [Komagataeibacter]PYD83366.1 ubiquinone biosynthesis protein UbiH [Komagataeibacter oboediens]GAN98774.1 hydroxylase/monooxygenase, ubiquinone biosynthesis hydroxylase [Komagataeibacter xylinus NBRC 13693]GBR35214.1 ubiquinone biosynthesis hydroxylase UbiH/UbiF/VisC/COQ6 [Komagataeibacter oboediens DSM 11826]
MTANMSSTTTSGPLEVDVCIVGAGPVGATLACRLASDGMKVAIIDRAALPPMEHPAFDGRAYAIAAGSRRLLEDAGVWQRLPMDSCDIREIRVTDGRPGRPPSRLFLEFGREDADQPFGAMIEARALRVALNASLHATPGLHVFAPDEGVVTRNPDGAVIRTTSGRVIHARLVVAAEGRRSPLRDQARITVTRLPYNQCGIVCAVAHERPHEGRALEHFLPAGPFAQLPMAGTAEHPNLSALVWTESEKVAHRLAELPHDAFAHEIRRRMGDDWLGAVNPVGRRWVYPLSAQYAQRYIDTRLALVGDAAHGIHPIAGQGLNLGFRDVIAMTDILRGVHAGGGDVGAADVLRRYQARCRPANMLMLVATDALERLFGNDNPVLRLARDVGLATVNRITPLRRSFARHAMGL